MMTQPMRFTLIAAVLSAAAILPARAATYEFFGGYMLNKTKLSDDPTRVTMNGWDSSIAVFPFSRLGFMADFAGYYGTKHSASVDGASGSTPGVGAVSVRQHSLMVGPQVRLIDRDRFKASFRALVGAARGHDLTAAQNVHQQTVFASLFGGNFDVKVSNRMSLRFSPGMYMTEFGFNQRQRSFRFSVGPVFRFGGGEE